MKSKDIITKNSTENIESEKRRELHRERLTPEQLGQNMRHYRIAKNMSHEKLAEALNLSVYTISRYERGEHTPDVFVLYEIAWLLDCTMEELVASDFPKSKKRVPRGSNVVKR